MINDYIKNIIENREDFRISNQQELVKFIVEVYKLYKGIEPNSNELSILITSFEKGVFAVIPTIDKLIENINKFDSNLSILYDKKGIPIKYFIK